MQPEAVLVPHFDHNTTPHVLGAAPATAAAAPPAAISATGVLAAAAAAAVAADGSGLSKALSPLDAALVKQRYALEPLLPTPTNINPVHLPRSDLLHFVAMQSWVSTNLNMQLPLLNGMFVLVPASPQQPMSKVLQAACGYSPSDSSTFVVAACAAIPWRLRQVSAVEVAPGVDPADATVVLVGGDRVRAGAVGARLLAEIQDHEYLCCEVADLQRRRQLRQLRVFDVAHMAWRLRVACDLEEAVKAFEQELCELAASSCDPATISQARSAGLQSARSVLMQLPPDDWVAEQVLQYVELNPSVWPESPGQPWQLLSAAELTQLLQDAAAAWQHYVQQRLAGQQPQPVTDLVPWLPITTSSDAGPLQEPPGDEPQQPVAQCPPAPVAQQLSSSDVAAPAQPFPSTISTEQPHPNTASQHIIDDSGIPEGSHSAQEPCSSNNTGGQHRPGVSQQPVHGSCREQLLSGDAHTSSTSRGYSSGTHSIPQGDPSRSSWSVSRSPSPSTSQSYSSNDSRSCSSGHTRSRSASSIPSRRRSRSRSRSCSCSISRNHSRSSSDVVDGERRPSEPTRSRSQSSPVGRTVKSIAYRKYRPWKPPEPPVQASRFFDPPDPWSQYVEAMAQQYLQQLALKVTEASGPPCKPGRPPYGVTFEWLQDRLPIPPLLLRHYESACKFVKERCELQLIQGGDFGSFLMPEHHARLLMAAHQQRQQQQAAKESLQQQDPGSSSSDWPEYLRPQQRLLEAAAAVAPAATAVQPTAAASAGPGAEGREGQTAEPAKRGMERLGMQPAAYAGHISTLTQGWLQQLAILLQPVRPAGSPPNCIKLSVLKFKLPIPGLLLQHHSRVVTFVEATPELQWAMRNHICLVPKWHESLLKAAEKG